MHLRLVTYNIHKGIGGRDRRYRPERIIETIAHVEPDVAFLQEVDEDVPRSRHDMQAELLASELGFRHIAFQRNVTLKKGWYGNAIVSRFPLSEIESYDLTVRFKKRRQALMARCKVPVGEHTALAAARQPPPRAGWAGARLPAPQTPQAPPARRRPAANTRSSSAAISTTSGAASAGGSSNPRDFIWPAACCGPFPRILPMRPFGPHLLPRPAGGASHVRLPHLARPSGLGSSAAGGGVRLEGTVKATCG